MALNCFFFDEIQTQRIYQIKMPNATFRHPRIFLILMVLPRRYAQGGKRRNGAVMGKGETYRENGSTFACC